MRFTRSETRDFIHDHVGELKALAQEAELETVVYLLGMVELETAKNVVEAPQERAA